MGKELIREIVGITMKCVNHEGDVCKESWQRTGNLRVNLSKIDGKEGSLWAWSGELMAEGAGHHDDIRKSEGNAEAGNHNYFLLYYGDEQDSVGMVSISGNRQSFTAAGFVKVR